MIVDVRIHVASAPLMALLAVSFLATPVAAQIPDEFTNLQVLPADISRGQLMGVMRSFSGSLGVRCTYCHVSADDLNGPNDDFAADDKPAKETARAMMAMVRAINSEHVSRLANRSEHTIDVSCITCHAGRPLPATLEQELTWAAEGGGYTALEMRYNELRERYFGRGSYDFGPRSLERVAEELARDDSDAAMAVLDLNLGYHPESLLSWMLKGQIHMMEDRTEQAVEAYERALELDPDSEQVAEALARARAGDA